MAKVSKSSNIATDLGPVLVDLLVFFSENLQNLSKSDFGVRQDLETRMIFERNLIRDERKKEKKTFPMAPENLSLAGTLPLHLSVSADRTGVCTIKLYRPVIT